MKDSLDLRPMMHLAAELARQAGELTMRWFQPAAMAADAVTIDTKSDGTPVTEADRGAERLLRRELGERFPLDGFLGEEDGEVPGTSGRRWVIDPIDGTTPFTLGVPLFSNLVALLDDTGPILGIINLPALGLTIAAARGVGCYVNGQQTTVTPRATVAGSMVMTSGIETWSRGGIERLQNAGARLRTWGDAYGYALVALGRVEAMVDPIAALWDLAPMPVILSEAGGRFSTLKGGFGPDGGNGVGTCGGPLHDELLALLAE